MEQTFLKHGDILTMGIHRYRFNNPTEAIRMKQAGLHFESPRDAGADILFLLRETSEERASSYKIGNAGRTCISLQVGRDGSY